MTQSTGWRERLVSTIEYRAAQPRTSRTWGPWVWLGAIGGLLAGISALIGGQRYGPGGHLSLSQANGLCSSALGQFAQATSLRASANCGSAAAYEQARGWLMIAAILAVLGACAWALYDRQRTS